MNELQQLSAALAEHADRLERAVGVPYETCVRLTNIAERVEEIAHDAQMEIDGLRAQVELLKPLARRCLWGAVNWNDHNFEPLYKYCRKSAADAGVFTVDQANALLEQTPAHFLTEVKAQAATEFLAEIKRHLSKTFIPINSVENTLNVVIVDAHATFVHKLRQQAKAGE